MKKAIPMVQKYMTYTPISIEKDAPLLEAATLMSNNNIRHLPVMNKGKIEGVLSTKDINLIRTLKDVDIAKLKVNDCYTPNAYSVKPTTPLTDVLDEMAEKKYGCVLINDNEHLVGIFTWVDALRAMSDLLKTRLGKW